jgi:YebC/PmpR family DNA-binding regulatory protein
MAGHSKSSNIKHRKNAQDAKRSRLFTKLTREVMVAARDNPDFTQNPRLRLARARALSENIKKETIEKAITKVTEPSPIPMEAIRYEGYGPGGIAILVDAFTDNRNRTASDMRYVFNRQGGKLGTIGSVAWLFHQKGLIQLAESSLSETAFMELAVEIGAEDIIFSLDNAFTSKLITPYDSLERVVQSLEGQSIAIVDAAPAWLPINRVLVEDSTLLDKIENCIETLEALPDVEAVYTSCSWQLD